MGGESFTADLGRLQGLVDDLDVVVREVRAIDVDAAFTRVSGALPGSRSAGAATETGYRMQAAAAVWGTDLSALRDGVSASASAYRESDASGSRRLERADPTGPR